MSDSQRKGRKSLKNDAFDCKKPKIEDNSGDITSSSHSFAFVKVKKEESDDYEENQSSEALPLLEIKKEEIEHDNSTETERKNENYLKIIKELQERLNQELHEKDQLKQKVKQMSDKIKCLENAVKELHMTNVHLRSENSGFKKLFK